MLISHVSYSFVCKLLPVLAEGAIVVPHKELMGIFQWGQLFIAIAGVLWEEPLPLHHMSRTLCGPRD